MTGRASAIEQKTRSIAEAFLSAPFCIVPAYLILSVIGLGSTDMGSSNAATVRGNG